MFLSIRHTLICTVVLHFLLYVNLITKKILSRNKLFLNKLRLSATSHENATDRWCKGGDTAMVYFSRIKKPYIHIFSLLQLNLQNTRFKHRYG